MTTHEMEQAHAVIAALLVKAGIEPTPAAIVEVLNHSEMPDVQKLAISISAPRGEMVKSLGEAGQALQAVA